MTPAGPQGSKGDTGSQGFKGDKGQQGLKGDNTAFSCIFSP